MERKKKNMKPCIRKSIFSLILFFLLIFSSLSAEINLSFANEMKFIYRDISEKPDYDGDKYKSYFSESLKMQAQKGKFTLVAKYDFHRPEYDQFAEWHDVGDEKNTNYFDTYSIQYEDRNIFLKGGIYDAVIGTGLTLHNFYDSEFDEDSRLLGYITKFETNKVLLQNFFGFMENQEDEDQLDQVSGLDFEITPWEKLRLGIASAFYRKQVDFSDNEYDNRFVYSFRNDFYSNNFDFYSEIALSNEENYENGHAIYAHSSAYINQFTFTASYKNYRHFDRIIHDLPAVSHSEEPISDLLDVGYDEEGLMGQIRFIPNYENEFLINYAEGWATKADFNLSDLFLQYKRNFDNFTIKTEFEHLEQKEPKSWYKELTPKIGLDFTFKDIIPITFKSEYQIVEQENVSSDLRHFEPKIQTDISYHNYSLSVISEHQYGDDKYGETIDFGDTDYLWIGVEFAAYVFNNTDIRLFVGEEKEGKVCRNGVCKKQTEFSGVRLEINTTF